MHALPELVEKAVLERARKASFILAIVKVGSEAVALTLALLLLLMTITSLMTVITRLTSLAGFRGP